MNDVMVSIRTADLEGLNRDSRMLQFAQEAAAGANIRLKHAEAELSRLREFEAAVRELIMITEGSTAAWIGVQNEMIDALTRLDDGRMG